MNALRFEDSLSQENRRAAIEVAVELIRLDHRLWELSACIPAPADEAEIWERDWPKTAAIDLRGTILLLRNDGLSQAAEKLMKSAQQTDEDLRLEAVRREGQAA